MYREIGQENETQEDSVTNLGGLKPGRSVFFSIMERQYCQRRQAAADASMSNDQRAMKSRTSIM
jgi:hypothetical protein